jgi:ribosomal protein S18 acetylase RimI-like enzyme
MKFRKILAHNELDFDKIYSAYSHTFPEEERRNLSQFQELTRGENVAVFSLENQDFSFGYAILWQFDSFCFLEHFEIFEEFRGQNLGSSVLKKMQSDFGNILLEIEPENLNDTAKKRLSFYKKNGFEVVNKNYVQPPYEKGKPAVKFWLLANFYAKKADEKCILSHVYGLE